MAKVVPFSQSECLGRPGEKVIEDGAAWIQDDCLVFSYDSSRFGLVQCRISHTRLLKEFGSISSKVATEIFVTHRNEILQLADQACALIDEPLIQISIYIP
jgi:hypothetical protein